MFHKRRFRGWFPFLILLFGVGMLGAMRESPAGGDVNWATSYEMGRKNAIRTHRPLLLSFHTPGCGWCEKMDSETFTDPAVVDMMKKFVCIRVDSDMNPGLVSKFKVESYPFTIIVNPDGKPLLQIPDYSPSDQFLPILKAVLDAGKK